MVSIAGHRAVGLSGYQAKRVLGFQNLRRAFESQVEESAYFLGVLSELGALSLADLLLQSIAEGHMIRGFRDLEVWQKGMNVALEVYRIAKCLPREETFGLAVQLRRAAISIPSNIAEGKAIGGNSYPRHVKIALGSEAELQTQIELGKRLKLIEAKEADALLAEVSRLGRMLVTLLNSLPRTRWPDSPIAR